MDDQGMRRKAAATDFLMLTASGRVAEAFDLYVGPEFRHHNINFKGDAGSLKDAMEESALMLPGKVLEIMFALQEDNMVAVYSKVTISPGGNGIALVHFFRFSDTKIIELWDLVQTQPDEIINENGMF